MVKSPILERRRKSITQQRARTILTQRKAAVVLGFFRRERNIATLAKRQNATGVKINNLAMSSE
jgi:hypothetical protein